MERRLLLLPLVLLTAAAPASQAVKTFDCTADGSTAPFKLKFGAGEYDSYDPDKSEWAANSCANATDCKFKGAVFTAAFGPNFFTYNRTTAHYVMADIFGDVTGKGKCVPE